MEADRLGASPRITLVNPRLAIRQRFHALIILTVPAALCLAAIAWHQRHPVSMPDVVVAASLYVLTLLGISVGFHRHFAHRAFSASSAVRVVLAILGSMAAQGPLVYWVSNHRRHHRFSDEELDPHSPYRPAAGRRTWRGFWHAQMGWAFGGQVTNSALFAQDLLRDPVIARVNALYHVWVFSGVALPVLFGFLTTHTWQGAWSGFLWGVGIRLFLTLHFTNAINSVCHMFGRQDFDTGDRSRNNSWLALPTLGESWHNNHHACPSSATFSRRRWQIDVSAGVIYLLEKCGLVWRVRRGSPDIRDDRESVESPPPSPHGSDELRP